MSYNGGINFGLLADFDSMDDVEVIADGIERALSDLGDAADEASRAQAEQPSAAQA
jgi:diacylglycerol O-acyltransferase / wax synthase